ncbi:MAG: hypothetical protein AB7N91_14305 [Candidatus Tectimicrobiota bacterium]
MHYPSSPVALLQAPPEDQALVVFLRPAFSGHAVSAAVYEEDRFIAIVMARTHIVHLTQPDSHRYMVVSEAADFLDADLAGGKMYFIHVVPRMGAWRARFSLAALTPHSEQWPKLKEWLTESYQVMPNEEGRAWNRNNYDSVREKKEAYLAGWLQKEPRPVLHTEAMG